MVIRWVAKRDARQKIRGDRGGEKRLSGPIERRRRRDARGTGLSGPGRRCTREAFEREGGSRGSSALGKKEELKGHKNDSRENRRGGTTMETKSS